MEFSYSALASSLPTRSGHELCRFGRRTFNVSALKFGHELVGPEHWRVKRRWEAFWRFSVGSGVSGPTQVVVPGALNAATDLPHHGEDKGRPAGAEPLPFRLGQKLA